MRFYKNILLILFFLINTNSFSNEKTNPITNEELKKIEKILNSQKQSFDKSKAYDGFGKETFQWLKGFIVVLIIMVAVFSYLRNEENLRNEEKEDNNKNKDFKSKIDNFVEKHDDLYDSSEKSFTANVKQNDDLRLHVQIDTIENTKFFSIYGIGPVKINSKKLEKDSFKAKLSVYVLDISEKPFVLKSMSSDFKDQNNLLCSSRDMEIPVGAEYHEYSKIALFPENLVVPAKKGKRKLEFKVYFTNLNMEFIDGFPKEDKKNEIYLEKSAYKIIEYNEPGFLETEKFQELVLKHSANLAIYLASLNKKIEQKEIDAIKIWLREKNNWDIFDYLDIDQGEESNLKKAELSFYLKQSLNKISKQKLNLQETLSDLNQKANSNQKYEIINLLLNVAASDDKLGIEEDKFINKMAKSLNLDLNYFQQIKNVALAKIENIEQTEDLDISVFNLTDEMTKEQKCLKLRQEYSRWNRQTNNSDENIRIRAKKMVEFAAELRKKYDC